jgi:MFS family permease
MHAPAAGTVARTTRAPGARAALALLLTINLFNYTDRQVLSAVLPKLELDAQLFSPTDRWLEFKLGLLTSAFLVSYTLLSPVFGWFGDRGRRWLVVGIGVTIWSLASGSSGLATSYAMLLITRCLVGIGEAAYGPVAPSMLSDLYPIASRGKVLALFYMAIPVGSALGFVIGGQVEAHFGWRTAFLVTLFGLVPAAVCFFMREPERPGGSKAATGPGYLSVLKELKTIRSFVLCCAGMTATTFMLGGVAAWTPKYVFQREARFAVTDKTIVDLRAMTTTVGEPIVPPDVVAKLTPLIGTGSKDFTTLKKSLLDLLGEKDLKQYGERIYTAATKVQFQLTADSLTELRDRKTSSGESELPTEVIDRLKTLIGRDAKELPAFQKDLNEVLKPNELERYQHVIWATAAQPDSITLGRVNFVFGAIVVLGGLGATLLGGLAGDWLRARRVRGAYFHAAGWTTLVAWPFFAASLFVPFPLAWGMLFVAVFFLFFNTGPANTILANVTRPEIRATAFAINILVIHMLGDVISPPLIGLIAGFSDLHTAILIVSLSIPVGGLLWVLGAKHLDADMAKVGGL